MKLFALISVNSIVTAQLNRIGPRGINDDSGDVLAPRALVYKSFNNDGFDFKTVSDSDLDINDGGARGKNKKNGGSKAALKVNKSSLVY